MRIDAPKEIFRLPKLKLAVIGHVEWVTFLKVDQLPLAGQISHAKDCFEEAAGGAAEGKDKLKTSEFEFGGLTGGLTALSLL